MDEPAEVRIGRGQRLLEATREDLDLYGVSELEERLEILAELPRNPVGKILKRTLRDQLRVST